MSLWAADGCGLGISAQELALASKAGAPCALAAAPPEGWQADHTAWVEALRALWGDETGSPSTRRLRVTLAPDLVRWWIVEPPVGAASVRDMEMLAAVRFEELFGTSAGHCVVQADWQAGRPSLCSAMPRGLADALKEAADEFGWRRWEMAPANARCRALALKAPPQAAYWVWLDWLGGHATLWWHHGLHPYRVVSVRVDPSAPWSRVRQEIERAPLWQEDDGEVVQVHWTTGNAHLAPPEGQGRLRWIHHRLPTLPPLSSEGSLAAQAAALGLM